MSLGGGGGGGQTVVEKADPPAFLQPFLESGLQRAETAYNLAPPQFFPGQTYVGSSPQTNQALGQIEALARQGGPAYNRLAASGFSDIVSGAQAARTPGLPQASQTIARTAGGGFLPMASAIPGLPGAYGTISRTAQGGYLPNAQAVAGLPQAQSTIARTAAGGFLPLAQSVPGLSASEQALSRTAAGDYLYGGPGFDRAVEAATRYTLPRISQAFEASGRRAGGGLEEEARARVISDAFAAQYGQERARQLQAAQLPFSAAENRLMQERARQQQAAGLPFGAAEQRYGLERGLQQQAAGLPFGAAEQRYGLERGLQSQAAQLPLTLANAGQSRQLQALGLAPTFNELAYSPSQRLAQVGGAREEEAALGLQDQIARWNYYQNLPNTVLDQFLSRVSGQAPSFGPGSSSSTSDVSRGIGSRIAGGLGGAALGSAGGTALGSALGVGSIFGLPIAGVGGALGGLLGLLL